MSSKKVADSMFRGGPVDKILTVDAYKTKNASVLNNLPDILKNTAGDAVKVIKKDPGLVKSITRDLIGIKNKTISKENVLLRLTKSVGNSSILRGLTGDVQGGIFKAFDALGVNKESAGAILGVTKSGISQYLRGDLDDLRGLADLAKEFTGNSEILGIFDLAAESAIMSSMIDYAIKAGAVDLLDDLVVKASTQEIIRVAYLNNVRVSLGYGDLVALNKIIDRIGVGGVLSQVPDAIKVILTMYRFPQGVNSSNVGSTYTQLLNTLGRIDPNWFQYRRNGEWITRLDPFTYASPDALSMFINDPLYQDEAMIAPKYPAVELVGSIKATFPMIGM